MPVRHHAWICSQCWSFESYTLTKGQVEKIQGFLCTVSNCFQVHMYHASAIYSSANDEGRQVQKTHLAKRGSLCKEYVRCPLGTFYFNMRPGVLWYILSIITHGSHDWDLYDCKAMSSISSSTFNRAWPKTSSSSEPQSWQMLNCKIDSYCSLGLFWLCPNVFGSCDSTLRTRLAISRTINSSLVRRFSKTWALDGTWTKSALERAGWPLTKTLQWSILDLHQAPLACLPLACFFVCTCLPLAF